MVTLFLCPIILRKKNKIRIKYEFFMIKFTNFLYNSCK
jgi:hypothetical protein